MFSPTHVSCSLIFRKVGELSVLKIMHKLIWILLASRCVYHHGRCGLGEPVFSLGCMMQSLSERVQQIELAICMSLTSPCTCVLYMLHFVSSHVQIR